MRYALNFKSGRSKEEDKRKAQRGLEKRDVQAGGTTFKDMDGWQGSPQAQPPQQRKVPVGPSEAPRVPSPAAQVVPPTVHGSPAGGVMPGRNAGSRTVEQPTLTGTAAAVAAPEKHRLSYEQPREGLSPSASFQGAAFFPLSRSRSNVNDDERDAVSHGTSHHTELVKSTDGGRTHITSRRVARPRAEGGDCTPSDGNPRLPGIRVERRKMSMDGRPIQAETEDDTGRPLTASSSFSSDAYAHAQARRRFSISTPSELALASRRNSSSTSNIMNQAAAAAAAAAGVLRQPPVQRGLSFSYDDPALDTVAAAAAAAQAAAAAAVNGASLSSTASPRASVPLSHSSSRVERLLRDRQIRRSSSYLQLDMSEACQLAAANSHATRPVHGVSGSGSSASSKRAANSGPLVPTTTVGGYHIGSPPQGGDVVRPEGSPGVVMPGKSRTTGRHMASELLGADSRNSSYDSLVSSRGSERGGGMGERSTSSGALPSYHRGHDGPGSPTIIPPLSSTVGGMDAHAMPSSPPPPPPLQRLLIVANRLPVRATQQKDGTWGLELSSGGLVSALLGVKENFSTCWIGWPGLYLKSQTDQSALAESLRDKGCVPVFLDEATMDAYYNGYCNNVLWPLLHYIGLPQEDRLSATRSIATQYSAYRTANEKFAEVVLQQYREGDAVWVHDYHLMLLPKFLKDKCPRMKLGWFLHTPFPSSEFFRTLPLRGEILQAVLAADLVGFHTYDYARHFVSACSRILGLEGTPDGVEDHGRLTRVAAFPIGIDSDRFISALETNVVKTHVAELRARFHGRKVMLGVDRLDMIKGIPQKLVAFEKFLEENPNWRDKVVLVQIAVPSRADVPEYQKLTSLVHEIVGRINGRFGTLTTVPIHHLDRSLAFHELCALYAITDVLLVTSLRDGMNLVSYEYVACQNAKRGVLILSEFAGAAQSLGAGAILVNPWNVVDVAGAIEDALTMPEEERMERHRYNFMHVTTHTAQAWADTFVSELNDTVVEAELRTLHIPPLLPINHAVAKFYQAANRLLILGYNATMTAQVEVSRRRLPDQIKEMKLRLHPSMPRVLDLLCSDPANTVVILSGSERVVLDETFSPYPCWLAAENGMFMRHTTGDWMTTMPEYLSMDWVDSVQLVFEYFTERTPRSYIDPRETSLVWNYKYSDFEFGRVQARDMLQHLWTGPISNCAVDVVQGGKSVEVRPVGVSKGAAMERILGEIVHQRGMTSPFDYVMVVGHFLARDEDIYTFFEPEFPPFNPKPDVLLSSHHPAGTAASRTAGEGAEEGAGEAAGEGAGEEAVTALKSTVTVSSSELQGGPAATDAAILRAPEGSPTAGAYPQAAHTKTLPTRASRAAEGSSSAAAGAAAAGAAAAVASSSSSSGPGSGHIMIAGSAGGSGMSGSMSRGWRGKRSASHRTAAAAAAPSIASLSGPSDLGKHDQVLLLKGDASGAGSHSGPLPLALPQSGNAKDRVHLVDPDDGGSSVEGGRCSGEYSPIVDLDLDCYFSCAVGRKRSLARFSLPSTEDVVSMLMYLADCSPHT